MTNRRSWMLGALSAALVAGCDRLGLPSPTGGAAFKGVDVTGANFSYALPDLNGQMRTPADFKGKVTAVFFGYTQCPDFCPTTMSELVQVKKALGADSERLQPVFITIDPERDTPEVLKAYVGHFDPGFVALRGTPEQAAAAIKDFKGFFAKAKGKTPESYTVDHTANVYLFDPKGRMRLVERYGAGVEALAADVKALLAGA